MPTVGGAMRPMSSTIAGSEPSRPALSVAAAVTGALPLARRMTELGRHGTLAAVTFTYEPGSEGSVDARLTPAKRREFEADFCRHFALVQSWAEEERFAAATPTELRVIVSNAFKISKSLVPAWYGSYGRMEFPAWRVVARQAAIAHELAHVFSPNGNRLLAEGLAVHLQDQIGENPAFPNFGRPLHELSRERLHDMVAENGPPGWESLHAIRLAELDAIATPSPLTLSIGQNFYGEEPRGQACIYPIAGSFVRFLIDTYGMEKFRKLYERTPLIPQTQAAGTPDRWPDIYGAALEALEAEWKSVILNTAPP